MTSKVSLCAALCACVSAGSAFGESNALFKVTQDVNQNIVDEFWTITADQAQLVQAQMNASLSPSDQSILDASTPSARSFELDPLSFTAQGIGCNQGYFVESLERCSAEIRVDVNVSANIAQLLNNQLQVRCDVSFAYEAGGEPASLTVTELADIELEKGFGQANMVARINFRSLEDPVTRIELTDLSCAPVSEDAS